MYPGVEHFNSNIKWKFDDSPGGNDELHNLEQNLDRIRSLSHERNCNVFGLKDNDNLLEVEVNGVVDEDIDDNVKEYNPCVRDICEDKSEYSAHKFSRTSSLSNRELDVIKESSRSSSDTEVTLTR